MNPTELITAIYRKYGFHTPISEKAQNFSFIAKKRVLKNILKKEIMFSFFLSPAISLYYQLKKFNITLTPVGSLRLVQAGSFAGLFIIISSGLLISYQSFRVYDPFLWKGSISFLESNTTILRKNTTTTAQLKGSLQQGDIIETAKNASLVFQLNEIGTIKFLPDTRAKIKRLDTQNKVTIVLFNGGIFSNLIKGVPEYIIETPLSRSIVTGTQFLVTHDDKASDISVLSGKVTTTIFDLKNYTLVTHKALHVTINKKVTLKKLSNIEILKLKKLSLYGYIHKVQNKSNKELQKIHQTIKNKEKEIDEQIRKIIDEWKNLTPLQRLKRMGKPITMIHLNDSSKIAGHVVAITKDKIHLDTGSQVIVIPRRKVIRRVPVIY